MILEKEVLFVKTVARVLDLLLDAVTSSGPPSGPNVFSRGPRPPQGQEIF